MTNNYNMRIGLVTDIELNCNLLEHTYLEYDEHYIKINWRNDIDQYTFHMDFKCYVLANQRYREDEIQQDFDDFLEKHLHEYQGSIDVECDDIEWNIEYKDKKYLRHSN